MKRLSTYTIAAILSIGMFVGLVGKARAAEGLGEVWACVPGDPTKLCPASPAYPMPVANVSGTKSALNLTSATVVKAGPGRLVRIDVIVAGATTPGTANDVLTTGAAAVTNQVATIPNAVGTYEVNWPCLVGIVIVPQGGQTLSVVYE